MRYTQSGEEEGEPCFPSGLRRCASRPDFRKTRLPEAMHKNPKLGLLFDRTARMTPEDLDAVLHIVRQMQRDE